MALRVWLWLVSLSVLWGGSFFFAKLAIADLQPLTVVFARVGLAALALHLLLGVVGASQFRRGTPWAAYFAMGALNNALPFSLIFWGQAHIASGVAAILNATTPLFTVVVAHRFTADEKLDAQKASALVLGLAGTVVLIGPDVLVNAGAGAWASIACLAAALSYALAGVYGRRFKDMDIPPLQTATGQVTASTLLILPIMLIVDRPWQLATLPTLQTWAALAGLALLSTALAYILYFRILAAAGATNLLLVTFLIPISAILLGCVFLGERLEPRHYAGMGLITVALALIDGRIARLLCSAK
jgi:drug/metabolite transporter (DMT)-like permease